MENLTKENLLALIPEKGISIRTILKKFGISVKEDKASATKALRLLKKLEKEGKIRKEDKTYFLITVQDSQKSLDSFAESKAKTKKSTPSPSKKKKTSKISSKVKKESFIKDKPKAELKLEQKLIEKTIEESKKKTKSKKNPKRSIKKKTGDKPKKKVKSKSVEKDSKIIDEAEGLDIIETQKLAVKEQAKNNIKKTKKTVSPVESEVNDEELSEGVIRQGSIAEFMRKRTQLVGFDIGFHKHTQFCAEFLDNSLDGIESYNWKFSKNYKLKNLLDSEQIAQIENAYKTIIDETSDAEYELTTKATIEMFKQFIEPVKDIISREPLIILRIREIEKPKMLPEEMHGKDIRMFCFEILDSGIGLVPSDLEKFGLYLASSKSANLKQTRGSQGFGASSAFSDSQNTTGRPITVITRHETSQNALLSVFYTTSKNEKEYAIEPETFRTTMQHGAYLKLYYLNVRYNRGYADAYIEQASFLNGHVTLIFIDPYGDIKIYPRRVDTFPNEPKYAQPHPASVLIGEFQDLLRSSDKKDIISFLSDSFVRMSKNHAKEIVEKANSILGAAQNLLTISPGELSDTNIRALYRNLTKKVICLTKSSSDYILKFLQNYENKPIIKVFSQFYDYNKEILNHILKNLNLDNKKSQEITIDDIKNIQEQYKEEMFCPYSISFAKFNNFLKENDETIENILSKYFCNLNNYTIKKLILKTEELLKIRNLYVLNSEELKKKELNAIYESIKKNLDDFELEIKDFEKFLNEAKGKSLVTTLKKLPGIGAKTLETILEECNQQLEYESLANTPANKMTTNARRELFVEMNNLEKCPSSITLNKFTEMLKDSKNKTLSSFISSNFSNLSKTEIDELLISTNESLGGAESLELLKPSELNEEQMNTLFRIFSTDKYLAPPTDTVVPVGTENLIKVIDKQFEPAFVEAETRKPTSGKGLAFGVEVAIAYGGKIKEVNRATDVLYRFVNRTPKLRDNSDCAIWKAVSSVNWKNYKLDSYDNGMPKGKIKVIVNVSGPFVHVMFKSQSKQALADDEALTREIQLGLEEVGRKLRSYLLKKEKKKKRARRASQLLKHVKPFAESLHSILITDKKFKEKTNPNEIEKLMVAPIKKDIREDILSILSIHWTPFDEIIEDLGLSSIKEKWIVEDLILPIIDDLLKQNIILHETREEIFEEVISVENEEEKKKIKKVKTDYYRLVSETQDENEVEEPVLTV